MKINHQGRWFVRIRQPQVQNTAFVFITVAKIREGGFDCLTKDTDCTENKQVDKREKGYFRSRHNSLLVFSFHSCDKVAKGFPFKKNHYSRVFFLIVLKSVNGISIAVAQVSHCSCIFWIRSGNNEARFWVSVRSLLKS